MPSKKSVMFDFLANVGERITWGGSTKKRRPRSRGLPPVPKGEKSTQPKESPSGPLDEKPRQS